MAKGRVYFHDIGDAGKRKEKDSDIIEKLPDGRVRVHFKTVSAQKTPAAMRKLTQEWNDSLEDRAIHQVIATAAMNLDSSVFICRHHWIPASTEI